MPKDTRIKIAVSKPPNDWINGKKQGFSKTAFIDNVFSLVKDKLSFDKDGNLILECNDAK